MVHDHDHERECGCGHDYEHEHGHVHTHEHHHDHDSDHGHDHEHSHAEAIELGWATADLEAHTHEQAATVSVTFRPAEESATQFARLVQAMQAIAVAAEDAGGVVGHIKAFARREDEFVHASVTAADIAPTVEGDAAFALNPSDTAQLVAIVLLIDQDELQAIVVDALSAL